MPTHKFHVPILAVALALMGLSSTSFGAPPRTGTFTHTLKFGGTSMKIKARVPMELPKEKTLGLILAFHPHGGNENSMVNWRKVKILGRLQKPLLN